MTKQEAEDAVVRAAVNWAMAGIAARAAIICLNDINRQAPATVEGFLDHFRAAELSHTANARNTRADLALLEAVNDLNNIGG